MKLREIFRFEFMQQARAVRTVLYVSVLVGVAYMLMRTAGAGVGVVNSPFAVAEQTVLCLVLWVVAAPAVAGSAAARDAQTRIHPLVYTTPISRTDYLGGRFLAAFALNALILVAVPVGILAALIVPGMDPATVGPLRPAVYLSSYGVMALTTAFVFTAVQFSAAALSRRSVVSYLATVLFFVAVSGTMALLLHVLNMPRLASLVDPIGSLAVLRIMSESWTPLQKSTVVVGLQGSLLAGRILWVGLALILLALTHARFRLNHRAR